MEIIKLGVVGAGTMGAGIAQRCAMHGYMVILVDTRREILKEAEGRIQKSLDKFVEKKAIDPEDKLDALAKIHMETDLNALADCDLVIEAVSEQVDVKKAVFSELHRLCAEETILASNTSSLSITELGGITQRSEGFVGLHFMNPVPLIDFVEIVRTPLTSQRVFEKCQYFVQSLGCDFVVSQDSPGFIVNRVLMPLLNEAMHALQSGVASAEEIDRALVLGTHQPVGPLALADRIGLDVVLSILETLHRELQSERFCPCELLVDHVRKNRLGRKTGRGFFEYEE